MFKYSKYVKENSIIHALNPFFKLLITILYVVSAFLAKSLMAYLFLLTFLLIVLIFSFIPDIKYYRFVYDCKFIILMALLIDLIIDFSISSFILTFISMIFSVLMIGAFLFTTKTKELIFSLEMLLYPLKIFGINTRRIAYRLASLSIYKPIFKDNKKSLEKELINNDKLMGFFEKIKIVHKNTIKKIDELNDVLIARDYFVYKRIHNIRMKFNDYLFTITEFVLLIAIVIRG